MNETPIGNYAVICAITAMLVVAAPLSVSSATATPVAEGQTTAVTDNVDVWERSLLPLRTTSEGPTTIAAPQTYINIESAQTGDVPLNREQYTIHEAGESVDLTFESTTGAGTSAVAGDEAQLLAVKLSDGTAAAGFSDGSVRTDLASVFTNDSSVSSVELLDDAEGVDSIDDNGVLETSYTPESGGAYGFILVTVDDGQGLSVSDNNVSTAGNVTVVGVEQTLVQDSASSVEATSDDLSTGDDVSFDVESGLEDDSVTHAVLVFEADQLQQQASTVRVTGDIDENFSEDQVTVENSFDGVNGVSTTEGDATLTGASSTTTAAMPSTGLVGLFGFVLSEASPDSTGEDVMYASATTVSDDPDTTVVVETLDAWPNGTYRYVHIAVGDDSNEISSDTGTVTLTQSSETDSGGDTDGSDSNDGSSDSDDNDAGGSGASSDTAEDEREETATATGTEEDTTETDTEEVTATEDGTATAEETATDDRTEPAETEDDEPAEAATTAGGGAQAPDTGGASETQGSVETTSSSGPGFTVLATVLALLGAGFLARRD